MDFKWTEEQEAIRGEVQRLCSQFGDEYWREKDAAAEFPEEFYQAMAAGGWLGVAMPEEYGGSGLGVTEAALILQEVAASGACMSGASAIHMNIFGVNPLVVHGTPEQKAAWLPDVIEGKTKVAFGVTEPDVGLDTTHLQTRAVRNGDHYLVQGRKVWISTAQVAHKLLLLARTTSIASRSRSVKNRERPSVGRET